jgi:hypothetical protein
MKENYKKRKMSLEMKLEEIKGMKDTKKRVKQRNKLQQIERKKL